METIYRDQNGDLWLLKNYRLFRYNVGDPMSIISLSRDNLSGTGLNMSTVEFDTFLLNHIFNDNPNSLEQWFLNNPNKKFYISGTQINIYPTFVMGFLRKFGVKVLRDSNGIRYVEDVNSWLATHMEQRFTNPAVRKWIRNPDSGIIDWLDHVIYFVNHNPVILNANVVNIGNAYLIIQQHEKLKP